MSFVGNVNTASVAAAGTVLIPRDAEAGNSSPHYGYEDTQTRVKDEGYNISPHGEQLLAMKVSDSSTSCLTKCSKSHQ